MRVTYFAFNLTTLTVLLFFLGILARHDAMAQSQETQMSITSDAFAQGERIPKTYTADGENIPPPLSWEHAPEKTKVFVLICDDPDAPMGTWIHWLVYDIPVNVNRLRAPNVEFKQGINDFLDLGYGGPAPPPGPPHRYFFHLYALSEPTGLPPGASHEDILQAMEGKILAQSSLMGIYGRQPLAQ